MTSPVLVIFRGRDEVCDYVDHHLEEMIGYSAEELLGRSLKEIVLQFVAKGSQSRIFAVHEARCQGKPTPQSYEVPILCKNGTTRKVKLILAHCLQQRTHVFIAVVALTRSIVTPRIAAEIQKVLDKHEWLGFDSDERFVLEAIRRRIEFLLSLPS